MSLVLPLGITGSVTGVQYPPEVISIIYVNDLARKLLTLNIYVPFIYCLPGHNLLSTTPDIISIANARNKAWIYQGQGYITNDQYPV